MVIQILLWSTLGLDDIGKAKEIARNVIQEVIVDYSILILNSKLAEGGENKHLLYEYLVFPFGFLVFFSTFRKQSFL